MGCGCFSAALCLQRTGWSFFHSIQISSVAVGLLSFSSFPLFVVFLEPLFFRERLRRGNIALAGAVAAGLALMPPSLAMSDRVLQGVLWGALSGFIGAVLSLLCRVQVRVYPALTVAFYQTGFAAFCVAARVALHARGEYSPRTLGLLAVLGVVFTALAQALFISSLRHLKVQLASIVVVSGADLWHRPRFAAFLGEGVPSLRTLLGGALILGAVFAAMFMPAEEPDFPQINSQPDNSAG